MKPLTVKKMIEFLKQFDGDLPIAMHHEAMGWIGGVEAIEGILYEKENDSSNKYYSLFEDDKSKRVAKTVLKIAPWYRNTEI
jgi:hypothetical protein